MTKRKRPLCLVSIRYKGKQCDFYARSTDEIIEEMLAWFRRNFEPKDWPTILKWNEGIKE